MHSSPTPIKHSHTFREHLLRLFLTITAFAFTGIQGVYSQRTATVTGHYEFYLDGNDDITIRDAKIKAIEHARTEAIKNEFGMLVASDFINIDKGANDEFSSFYMMDASTSAKGEWLGDEEDPKVKIEVTPDGNLCFIAEVKGKAREIARARTDLKWSIQKEIGGKKVDADQFVSGERFFVNFMSPSDGYIAIYLITGDDETACLLPYRQEKSGRMPISAGHEYTFFDKKEDPEATYYKFSTDHAAELNQLVILYSPQPFTKCTDTSQDPKKPNILKSKDFARWLLKAQRADNNLVVNKKWIKILAPEP